MKNRIRTFQVWFWLCIAVLVCPDVFGLSLTYEVQKGDTLWSISQAFQMSVQEIKRINRLSSNRVYPGQVLRLGTAEVEEIPAENGPYYWAKPKVDAQQSRNYTESSNSTPLEDYRQAQALLQLFEAEIEKNQTRYGGKLPLKGWKIAIDPGHGGIDPGAIVANSDGLSRSVYVVEDEYVYDISLRVYERLRLYGAEVVLTVVSPNHLIRENIKASVTFVHEQNEVYNNEAYNRKNASSVRPQSANLSQRVHIANRFFKGGRKGKTLFVSIHADNSPGRPKGPLSIYLKRRGKVDRDSKKFAQVMQKALDSPDLPAQLQGRSLWVLRNNQAQAEILVETHNVHDKNDAYRIRFHKNRKEAAERIVQGILDYAGR
ncbi:MAG: N-acetylmuramoyl-L-alanine amidase [bacterium]|nr:N-acetylmuramoyl-L-alanine amidase [bacterium]